MPKKKSTFKKTKQGKSFSGKFPDVFPTKQRKPVAFGNKKAIRKGPKVRKRSKHKKVIKKR